MIVVQVLIALLFAVFSMATCVAQPPPMVLCMPFCSGATLTPVTKTVMISPTCSVTLKMYTRSCAGTHELYVDSASFSGTCGDIPAGERVQKALNMVVHQNEMNFPPSSLSGPGITNWKITRPTCWQISGSKIIPCSGECCINHLRVVKKEGCDDFQVIGEWAQSPPRACPKPAYDEEEESYTVPTCNPACGTFYSNPGERR